MKLSRSFRDPSCFGNISFLGVAICYLMILDKGGDGKLYWISNVVMDKCSLVCIKKHNELPFEVLSTWMSNQLAWYLRAICNLLCNTLQCQRSTLNFHESHPHKVNETSFSPTRWDSWMTSYHGRSRPSTYSSHNLYDITNLLMDKHRRLINSMLYPCMKI